MKAIILCGGSGKRLWPLSRNNFPKQFIKLENDRSLFQKTLLRAGTVASELTVAANKAYDNVIRGQLDELNDETVSSRISLILEPLSKNTAPAIALATGFCDDDDILLVTPSDQHIDDNEAFRRDCADARLLAEKGFLVVFGVTPGYPETGYGYIEYKDGRVTGFREKPDADLAKRYVEDGLHYWNCGIFCFKKKIFEKELRTHAPALYKSITSVRESLSPGNPLVLPEDRFSRLPNVSIDTALFEKTANIALVPASFQWSDIGSFDSLRRLSPGDGPGTLSDRNFYPLNAENNFVINHGVPVAAIDVNDLIIVNTLDALLICKQGSSQKIRDFVDTYYGDLHRLIDTGRLTYHPWGSTSALCASGLFKLTLITVKPGRLLPARTHARGAGHWIVADGQAVVIKNGDRTILDRFQSMHLPPDVPCSVENTTDRPLSLIELLVGDRSSQTDRPN